MKLDDAINLVNESNAQHTYKIYIPSVGEEIAFKPMTTGQQKTLSKFSIEASEFNLSYEFVKIGLFDNLKVNTDVSGDQLTEVDMVAFFAGLRLNNISESLTVQFKCSRCEHEFEHNLDFVAIMNKAAEREMDEYTFEFDADDNHYEMLISEPTYKNIVELESFVQMSAEDMDMSPEEVVNYRALNKPAIYIKEVKINGNAIDNFEKADFVDKLKFYNMLPPKISFSGEKSILNLILEQFDLKAVEKVAGTVKCTNPSCGKELEGVLTNDSFFII